MPQIWMTYDELATLSGCSAAEARLQALHLSLDRRKSRDGNTRVKLSPALMARFFATVRDAECELDGAIAALRDTHRQMSGVLTNGRRVPGAELVSFPAPAAGRPSSNQA